MLRLLAASARRRHFFYGVADRLLRTTFGGAKSSFGNTVEQLFHYAAL